MKSDNVPSHHPHGSETSRCMPRPSRIATAARRIFRLTACRLRPWAVVLAAGWLAAGAVCGAEFAPVFTNGCVLQRDQPVAVWGTGRDGESVKVSALGNTATATVDGGRWKVVLPAMPSTASTTLKLEGDRTVELTNVAIGEVWICSGQSNMEWRLNQCAQFTAELLASASNPAIRQIKIPLRAFAGDPLPKIEWKAFDTASAGQFSAVAYFFAAELNRKLGVPVGIVNCTFGGTPIEAWMSREALVAAGRQDKLDEDALKAAAYPTTEAYEKAWQEFETARKAREERKKSGVPENELGPQPVEPYGFRSKSRPTGLRESMLSLVTPYTARGMLWYQGENNAGKAAEYAPMLKAFMATCRADWSQPEWPILIGQLSSPSPNWPDDQDPYAVLREAQRSVAAADPHSGLVVTLDHGERANVHPINKQPVGERFARLALGRTYGQSGFAPESPQASSATLAGNTLQVAFSGLPGRLELRDPAIPTLEIQDSSGSWKPASGKLSADGKSLVIDIPAGSPAPDAVRYAWRNFCTMTLFTDEGLPVSPWSLKVK